MSGLETPPALLSSPSKMRAFLRCLLLATLVCLTVSCSSDDPDAKGPGGFDPTGQPGDGGLLDGAVCIAKGCDELGYKCGKTVDNCGNPLDCDQPGSPCMPPLRCGGDPDLGAQVCGCKVRANPCEAQGAQCGAIDECGQAVDCGTCAGGALCLANRCVCTPQTDPCKGRTCGTAPDGCGGMVSCGPQAGQCASGACDASGQCACRPSAEACAGKLGPHVENGCSYECGITCTAADNAAACAGAECGTARNRCGDTVPCGSCAAGSTCVPPQFVRDETLPERSASFGGGYCVASSSAKMLGKYAVRLHAFRQAGSAIVSLINRAESVSLLSVGYTRATGQLHMHDLACVATGVGDPATPVGRATFSTLPRYRNLLPADAVITVTGDRWQRADAVHPLLGNGTTAGWTPGMPSYCVGRDGQEVPLPDGDPRRGQSWLPGDRCVCPTAAEANRLPRRPGAGDPNNYALTALRDCRITDEDRDGKPGYTAIARSLFIDSEVYAAGTGHGLWQGIVRDDRHHLGITVESPIKTDSVTLGCARLGGACSAPTLDCGCPHRMESVYFVPLADDAPMDCAIYVSASDVVDQTRIDAQFGAGFGTCTGAGTCPAGALCRAGKCFVQTGKGACAKETCPSGDCEPCPAGTTCRSDGSCWPTTATCPPRGPLGGLCEGAN
ncbi:MAG: hypothetical protein ABW252_01060 [Polyangiales bacterium]